MMPLLPLDTFRHILGMHPYHFWQLANATIPVTAECNDVTYQYAWQNTQAASRSDILQAIETAESRLREWLATPAPPADHTVDDLAELHAIADLVEEAGGRAWAAAEARRQVVLAEQALAGAPVEPGAAAELVALARSLLGRSA